MSILTFKYRVKDASAKRHLKKLATGCNQVWNYCVQIQREAQSRYKAGKTVRWPTHFDLVKLTTGCASEVGIHSDTVNKVCAQFVASRDLHKKCPAFRASFGAKAALGWVPFIPRAAKVAGDCVSYRGRKYRFWKSRDIDGKIKCGSFVQDARGRWYVTFQCEVADDLPLGNGSVGIDLGLKTTAVCSDGTEVPALRIYRKYETQLAIAQRAGNKKRVRAIHAKIANARKHQLHEASTKIVRANALIVVGDVSASKLAKTRMAKSVLDAGWSSFKTMLRYKASRHGAMFIEASERMTSQTCSCCGTVPASSPKGMSMLGIRHWTCSDCGVSHDRDVNAALNILRVGQERLALAGEIPVL